MSIYGRPEGAFLLRERSPDRLRVQKGITPLTSKEVRPNSDDSAAEHGLEEASAIGQVSH